MYVEYSCSQSAAVAHMPRICLHSHEELTFLDLGQERLF
jgi:hypothetical protein